MTGLEGLIIGASGDISYMTLPAFRAAIINLPEKTIFDKTAEKILLAANIDINELRGLEDLGINCQPKRIRGLRDNDIIADDYESSQDIPHLGYNE